MVLWISIRLALSRNSLIRGNERAICLIAFKLFIASLLLYSSVGYTQEQDHIDHGPTGTMNWDYFTANQRPETKQLLYYVNLYHFGEEWWKNFKIGRLTKDIIDGHILYTLGRFPNYPKALTVLEMVFKLTNNPAILPKLYYEKALRLYPQYALTHAQYGAYLANNGNIKSGIAELNKAIEIEPKLAVAHAWLAKAYQRAGNLELAREAATRATELGYKGKIQ